VETIVKVVLTVLFTAIWLWSLGWVWKSQIDPQATIKKWVTKPFEPPGWVATRDPKKVYQNGVAVGDVTGDVNEGVSTVRFAQIANAGSLKRDAPVDWQRHRLRIVQIEAVIGMKSVVTDQGTQVLTNVMEGVACEIIRQ